MEQLKMHSPDLTQEKIAQIRDLFPGCVTEAHDAQGRLRLAVDFDLLRQELADAIVEGPQERYHLNWPGKREALLTANAPIAKTLRPCREESVDFDTTQNLFIEGDNLEALKLLQETYLGKVKMIYIDPPYNTGNDFIYEDDFAEDTEEFFMRSYQKDDEGNHLIANTEANGRFHSDWLSMMYPRLKLARNILRDDGVIFISIGDDEQASLKKLCDDIFGSSNFLGCACRVSKKANNQGDYWSPNFDYVLTYARDRSTCEVFFGGVNYDAYNQVESEGPRAGEKYQLIRLYMTSLDPMRGCTNQRYFIEAPDGTLLIPPGNVFPKLKEDGAKIAPETGDDKVWRWSQESYLARKNEIVVKEVRSSNLVDRNGDKLSGMYIQKHI
ncbi:MAG: site-specific DNA-methyltransferase [Caldilineaceae bacterium]